MGAGTRWTVCITKTPLKILWKNAKVARGEEWRVESEKRQRKEGRKAADMIAGRGKGETSARAGSVQYQSGSKRENPQGERKRKEKGNAKRRETRR
jgi:hypothetical protein